ncbi:thymic stromal cotransporter homolog [Callorhinchus milii]|uniref:Thymic stromal cotransporter homolog n=1 Tax=Callorhinchus milii TaxID=7868 RepID=A0A4W3JYI4_CALMI|nr:thymic stromal cotransporter homolog [Callorhinchus milii]|eukprot:gi/632966048/ref/XP_007899203.1/ PREDICTED: thymic stromal cotransporter homolog [Callorhinchus milii]
METLLSCVEPVVVVTNVANSLFDTAMLMVVYGRLNETSHGNSDETQKEAARFYMIYNMIYSLAPLLSTVPLGKLADRRGQKILVVVPLVGYLLGRSLLLFTEVFQLPVSVMYGSAIINGLTGGFPAYWSGINAIAALRSGTEKRSLRLNMLSVTSGMAGLLGSIVSGHFFLLKVQNQDGLLLIIICLSLYTISLLYSATILRYPAVPPTSPAPAERPMTGRSKYSTEVILLFICYILYDFSVTGGANVVSLFVLKPPLSWDSVWVGYGKAASYVLFLTSFLGVLIFSRWMSDTSLVLMGIISNTIGFTTMAFVTRTPLYFVARSLMMFSCIPLPTIRAQLSKEMDKGSYGSIFAWLQSIMALTDVIATVVFNNIYPATLEWYSGFSLLLAAAISLISLTPIVVYSCKQSRESYNEVPGLDSAQTLGTVECPERPVKL